MLSGCYIKIMDKISYLQAEMCLLMKYAFDNNSFEDKQAGMITENLIEHMKAAAYELRHLSFPAVEGKVLRDKTNNRFEFVCDEEDRLPRWPFFKGDHLEVLGKDGVWHFGNIMHTSENENSEVYLDNSILRYHFLFDGMRGRIRKEV